MTAPVKTDHVGATERAKAVKELAQAYGGSECYTEMNPVLGKANIHDSILRACRDWCLMEGDTKGAAIAEAMLCLSWNERCFIVDAKDPERKRRWCVENGIEAPAPDKLDVRLVHHDSAEEIVRALATCSEPQALLEKHIWRRAREFAKEQERAGVMSPGRPELATAKTPIQMPTLDNCVGNQLNAHVSFWYGLERMGGETDERYRERARAVGRAQGFTL